MGSLTDLTGRRFGRLLVVRRGRNRGRRVMWLCQCACGHRKLLATDYLTSKGYRSCGCLRNEITRERSTIHGHTVDRRPSKEYRAWAHMKGRCYNPTDARFPSCGGRGIRMHRRWRNDFTAFLRDLGRSPPDGILRRFDLDRNYEPGNCAWQSEPRRKNSRRDHRLAQRSRER